MGQLAQLTHFGRIGGGRSIESLDSIASLWLNPTEFESIGPIDSIDSIGLNPAELSHAKILISVNVGKGQRAGADPFVLGVLVPSCCWADIAPTSQFHEIIFIGFFQRWKTVMSIYNMNLVV